MAAVGQAVHFVALDNRYRPDGTLLAEGLQEKYQRLSSRTDAEIAARKAASPLYATSRRPLPRYFAIGEVDFPDLFAGAVKTTPVVSDAEATTHINDLGTKNYWTFPVAEIVNPFIGDGTTAPYTGTAYMSKHVGDKSDTSPYPSDNPPDIPPYVPTPKPLFIVTSEWIRRMGRLISYISPVTS